jgi:hypothetical protein
LALPPSSSPLLGPFAWMHGKRVVREIDSERLDGDSAALAGRNLGIVAILSLIAVFALGVLGGVPTGPTGV